MKRASKPASPNMPLSFDAKTERYITSERGITYHLPHSLLDSLKQGFRNYGGVEGWFQQLSRENKKLVYRQGLPDNTTEYHDGDFID